MKRILKQILTFVAVVGMMIFTQCITGSVSEGKSYQRQYEARVDWIHDGDTVTVFDNMNVKHKLRLYAIDAPELAQPFGKDSMRHLMQLLPKKEPVWIEVENMDRYGREVATIYRGDFNVNRQQIADGYAWHYKKYDKKFYVDYEGLEISARQQRLGLWHYPNAKEPWEYRAEKRNKKAG